MVRRGASQALATLASKVSEEHVSDFLLANLKQLLDDKTSNKADSGGNDFVKVYALSSAIPISDRLGKEIV